MPLFEWNCLVDRTIVTYRGLDGCTRTCGCGRWASRPTQAQIRRCFDGDYGEAYVSSLCPMPPFVFSCLNIPVFEADSMVVDDMTRRLDELEASLSEVHENAGAVKTWYADSLLGEMYTERDGQFVCWCHEHFFSILWMYSLTIIRIRYTCIWSSPEAVLSLGSLQFAHCVSSH